MEERSSFTVGSALAIGAAVAFGATTPIIAHTALDPFSTAALLYAGAGASAFLLRPLFERFLPASGTPIRPKHVKRLIAIAIVGAGIAPALLAWGLARTGATTGSLLLNLEAVFTALLARFIGREPIGRRVMLALALMVVAGAALTFDAAHAAAFSVWGSLAIVGATAAWGVDNLLTLGLAEVDPILVVGGKGLLGATVTGVLAARIPPLRPALVLLATGAVGYGLSLRLYLLAQRRIGAARTGSIFAVAPFIGAAIAWLAGDRVLGPMAAAATVLFAIGVALHVTERHRHRHLHEATDHEHAHRHDDGHHTHVHDPPFFGEHSHPHHHDPIEHDHEHGPDAHHDHTHG